MKNISKQLSKNSHRMIQMNVLGARRIIDSQVLNSVWAQLYDQVWTQIYDQVRDRVKNNVRNQVIKDSIKQKTSDE